MGHSSDRGQTEPLAALAAVVVVTIAFALYAGAFESSLPGESDRNVAQDTADRVERALTIAGIVQPTPFGMRELPSPEGYLMNVSLTTATFEIETGPAPPADADTASRRVSVAVDDGRVRPGRLEVRVWT